jgi:hypothetical protein
MAGLVPAIPIMKMQCSPNRDRRDEPGDDVCGASISLEHALIERAGQHAPGSCHGGIAPRPQPQESAVEASPVHFFQHCRRRSGKTGQDHIEVVEKHHAIGNAGNSRRQFESAHPLQSHRVEINAGTRFHVEAAKLELVANFELIGRSVAPIPRRAECRSQTAQRE